MVEGMLGQLVARRGGSGNFFCNPVFVTGLFFFLFVCFCNQIVFVFVTEDAKRKCFCNQSINRNPYVLTPYPINMNKDRQRIIRELKKVNTKMFNNLRKKFENVNDKHMVDFMDWMERTQSKGYAVAILEEMGYVE